MKKGTTRRPTLQERLAAMWVLDQETGCHVWQGHTCYKGYGMIWDRAIQSTRKAHRLAWTYVHGPIADGMSVCHHCDNRRCVNVAHMFLGTNADNTRDKMNKGRHRSPQGVQHPMAVLTESNVREIRQMRADGHALKDIAARFGCSAGHVSKISIGKNWAHVTLGDGGGR